MQISFNIKYPFAQDESIFLVGGCHELGNFNLDNAVALQYNNGEWSVNLDIDLSSFEYSYFVKNNSNKIIQKEWTTRKFYSVAKDRVMVKDEWLYPNLPEFNLNTDFFNYLGEKKETTTLFPEDNNSTHRFQISFRLMNNDAMYILGNCEALGNWDENKAIPLQLGENNTWFIELDMSTIDSEIAYKYVVKDKITNVFKYYELGNDRILEKNDLDFVIVHNTAFRQPKDEKWKGSGVVIPIFSLRSEKSVGVGEFSDLIEFGDWAKSAGFSMIQILPIHDTTSFNDWRDCYPYSGISVYALHPMYVRLQDLSLGLTKSELLQVEQKAVELNKHEGVEYVNVNSFKFSFLKAYFKKNYDKIISHQEFQEFLKTNASWVKYYACFSVLRDKYNTPDFSTWKSYAINAELAVQRLFKPDNKLYKDVMYYVFIQWELHLQLSKAVAYLHKLGVTLKGDLPIGIFRNSVDSWAHPSLFNMNQQAGAPPDDFAVMGQNWKFPTYNWEVMKENNYHWWKSRFEFMSTYFDAFRIDHILGFFRIWQIPTTATQGILGRFSPAIAYTIEDLKEYGIDLPEHRLWKPYLHYELLKLYFEDDLEEVIQTYLNKTETDNEFEFKKEFDTQKKIVDAIGQKHLHTDRLLELQANVLFVKEENELLFHPRFTLFKTNSYKWLNDDLKEKLYNLHEDYFFNKQEEFWREKGLEKLPILKKATNMLTCGEDLGMVPQVVPQVMQDLAILSLQVQRMPALGGRFSHPNDAPYLSVVTPSSHDTSTLRQWWKENRENTQYYFTQMMGHQGNAPEELSPKLQEEIIDQHLYSPAMLCVIPIQEFLGMNENLRNPNEDIERINIPSVFPHYWKYRMHINISDLKNHTDFTEKLKEKHRESGRLG